jgi:hypothetical protein
VKPEQEPTHFLNVDLEISSTLDLAPLLAVWGESVFVLHSDRVKRTYRAFLEIGRIPKSADQVIRVFCKLIESLPRADRKIWDSASKRDLNIGIAAGLTPSACDFTLSPETVRAIADVGARIVFTVYGAKRTGA